MRVTIVGNSNSIMQRSYSKTLGAKPDIDISQASISDTPGVVLLEFVARQASLDTDVIVVETFVVDAHWVRLNRIDRAEVRRNLDLFLTSVRQASSCRIILVVLPVRSLLISEKRLWIEDVAQELAAIHDVDVLNVYAILRSLFAPGWKGLPAVAERRTRELLQSVGLPASDWAGYLWTTGLRLPWVAIGPLLRQAFQDELHISEAIHALVADILDMLVKLPEPQPRPVAPPPSGVQRTINCIPATGTSPDITHRRSSILTRDFTVIDATHPAVFKIEQNQRAVGILVNRSKCFGVVTLSGASDSICYDLRLAQVGNYELLAGILPIPKDLGDGDIAVSVADRDRPGQALLCYWDTTASTRDIAAEIGNLVLIDRDWERNTHAASQNPTQLGKRGVETRPWASDYIRDFTRAADLGAASAEYTSALGLRPLLTHAIDRAGSDSVMDRARLFIALGDLKAAAAVIEKRGDDGRDPQPHIYNILQKIRSFQKDVQN